MGSSDCQGTNVFIDKNTMKFQVECNGETFDNFSLNMGGVYNVMNAVASVSVANLLDVDSEKIIDGINTFKGINRRFETHISSDNLVFIDDYAHHPKEITESINAVKQMYPERKITVVFQPHLYSRTKDFMNEFANSLSLADELILLDIYGAREKEIEGVSSQILLNKCTSTKKELSALDSIVEKITDKEIDVLLTLGAGDISTIIEPLRLQLL